MTVKADEALTSAASRFDFAICICSPCSGDERKVKDGASGVDKQLYPLRWKFVHTIMTLQVTFQVLSLLQEPLKFSMQYRKLFAEPTGR
jgi:hypothetical protein